MCCCWCRPEDADLACYEGKDGLVYTRDGTVLEGCSEEQVACRTPVLSSRAVLGNMPLSCPWMEAWVCTSRAARQNRRIKNQESHPWLYTEPWYEHSHGPVYVRMGWMHACWLTRSYAVPLFLFFFFFVHSLEEGSQEMPKSASLYEGNYIQHIIAAQKFTLHSDRWADPFEP